MKRFVTKSITIIIPILLFMVGYEIVMRSIPNDYSYKSELWGSKVDSIQVLILGNSHSYYGFNPSYFNKKAYNAAHVSQSYNYDWFLFNKYFEKMTALEYVIIPISVFSPYNKLDDSKEYWRCKEYAIHYSCPFYKWYEIKYRYHFYNISVDNLQRAVSKLRNTNYNDIHVEENGYSRKTLSDQIKDFSKNGIETARRHSVKDYEFDVVAENKKYLLDIISRSKEKGIKVLFVTTPGLPEYYSFLDSKQIEYMDSFGMDMQKYSNVKYLNLLKSQSFNKNDFYDVDHLCDNGAKKMSLIVNEILYNW